MRSLFSVRVATWSMVLALALMLAGPDHWGISLTGGHDHHAAGGEAAEHVEHHSRHCHGKAATCTDLPVQGIGGLASLQAWLAAPEVFADAGRVADVTAVAPDAHSEVATPPPRA